MARILDLDLDFFLDRVCRRHVPERLPSTDYRPWSEGEVRMFLQQRCGLSRDRRLPGYYAEKHHGAFEWWRSLVRNGRVSTPFDVVHIDAHADLGMAVGGWTYLMEDVLHRPPEQRHEPEIGEQGLNEANYLLFAIACRWIRSLTYVHHPNSGDNEYIPWTFRGDDVASGEIELKAVTSQSLRDKIAMRRSDFDVVSTEPPVPFRLVAPDQFRAEAPFDFMFLCQSPNYTPPESDALLSIIREYMAER